MNHLTKIEASTTRKGEFIAYINGAQRVRRSRSPWGWETYELGSSVGTFTPLFARTLIELDAKIERLTENDPVYPQHYGSRH